MRPVTIGLLGLGTVGGATVNTLLRNQAEIIRRAGRPITIKAAAVKDATKPRVCCCDTFTLVTDLQQIVDDPDIDIVVELLGGIEPAKALLLRAIAQGKHVVTANKALLALHGNELFTAAYEKGVNVAFEAAVAGGIPIIKTIREALTGNAINEVRGIINGTSNYILTEMAQTQADFQQVLAQAQALGYAEADPSFDIEGTDVAHKLTILAAIAFGIPLQFAAAYVEGIKDITALDLQYAKTLGFTVKHMGIARRTAAGVELRVHPIMIREQELLASVNGVKNAILVEGDTVGETVYYGPGAGGDATASAVVADLVDVTRVLTVDSENRVPHLAFQPDAISDLPIIAMDEIVSAYYLRLMVQDKAGVFAAIATILAKYDISIEALLQQEPPTDSTFVPIVILTKDVREAGMRQALAEMENLAAVHGAVTRIRLQL